MIVSGRRAFGVGLGVVFLAAISVQAVALARSWSSLYWVPGALAAFVVCGFALVRHRWPVGAAVAGLVVGAVAVLGAWVARPDLPAEPGPAMSLGLAVLVGSVVRSRSAVTAAVVAGVALGLAAGSQLVVRPHAAGLTPVATIYLVAWSGAVATGLTLRLMDGRAQAAAERTRQVERMELARELHDIVAHHVTGILLQAQAGQIVARRDPGRVSESLAEIEAVGAEALTAMRRMVGLLRDGDDADPVRPERLDELVERFGRQGPAVTLSMPSGTRWPPEVDSTVYRVVQESLTNVLRHSPDARAVSVSVGQDGPCVVVEVVDSAPPNTARPSVRGGYGLVGMRERVEALGGTLSAGPLPQGGWSVRASLPVREGG